MGLRSLVLVVPICGHAQAAELMGRVVGAHDGDTISVLDAAVIMREQ